jgi:hypothetical protein
MQETEFWHGLIEQMVQRSDEAGVGDSQDRLQTLADKFKLPVQDDVVEEFDGLNHEEAHGLVFVVALPILKHAQALKVEIGPDLLSIRVPNLYLLELGLPRTINTITAKSYFDCKLRKLILVMETQTQVKPTTAPTQDSVDTKRLESDLLFDVI